MTKINAGAKNVKIKAQTTTKASVATARSTATQLVGKMAPKTSVGQYMAADMKLTPLITPLRKLIPCLVQTRQCLRSLKT